MTATVAPKAHHEGTSKRQRPNATGSSTGAKAGARGYLQFTPDYSNPSHTASAVSRRSAAERNLDGIFAEDLRRAERSADRHTRQPTSKKKDAKKTTAELDAELQSLFEECLGTDKM